MMARASLALERVFQSMSAERNTKTKAGQRRLDSRLRKRGRVMNEPTVGSAAFHLSTFPTSEGVSLPASTSASMSLVLAGSPKGLTSFVHLGFEGCSEGIREEEGCDDEETSQHDLVGGEREKGSNSLHPQQSSTLPTRRLQTCDRSAIPKQHCSRRTHSQPSPEPSSDNTERRCERVASVRSPLKESTRRRLRLGRRRGEGGWPRRGR